MILLTQTAQDHLQQQLSQRPDVIGIRIGVKNSGCNGFAYTLDFAKSLNLSDEVFDFDTIKIMVDQSHLGFLQGTTLDYVTEGLNATFKFNNPKVKSECGCGESFSVDK